MKRHLFLAAHVLPMIAFAPADEGTASGDAETSDASKTITIQGIEFDVTTPYAEGHTCSEAEAKALNQTRAENIRNNMASKVKAAQAEAGFDETTDDAGKVTKTAKPLPKSALSALAAEVAEYDAGYEFTLASVGGGRASRDPIEIEATKIAKNSIVASLKAKGRTLKSVTHDENGNEIEGGKERLAEAIAKVASGKDVIAAARKAVAEREKLASADIAELAL